MNLTHDNTKASVNQERENFERLYVDVRTKEERLYSLQQVADLPEVSADHVHYHEWKMRKTSCHQLINYLKKKNKRLKILEVGCGNGWLSNKIAFHLDAEVVGLDINKIELEQAKATWRQTTDLSFVHGDIRDNIFPSQYFDVILFAASIQYFSSLKEILLAALSLLNTSGEIHIMDSNFYSSKQVSAASERTNTYYAELGFPEMSAHYFHHSWNDLKQFNYKLLDQPRSIVNLLKGRQNIFSWIKITK